MAGCDCLNCDLAVMPDDGLVFDMVSAPAETPLIAAARARGLAVVTGLDMLVEQAAASFKLMFGADPPRDRDADLWHRLRAMITLALTGSIGMGKSTVAAMFADAGVPVFDADAVGARAAGPGRAAGRAIEARFPGTTRDGAVDREALRRAVLGDPAELAALEAIVHPADLRNRRLPACCSRGECR